jgi:hypothetical protein
MKLLFITPTLKDDNRAKYLLNKIESLVGDNLIWCLEISNSQEQSTYKDKIQSLLEKKFLTILNDQNLSSAILSLNPDIVSFEEFSQTFISQSELDVIYNSNLKIFESTFDATLELSELKYQPLKLIVTTTEHFDKYFTTNFVVELITPPEEISVTIQKKVEDVELREEIKNKISAYHILTDIDSDREVLSQISLSKLSYLDIDYYPMPNKRFTELPPADTCEYPDKISMEPGGKLTPGHYGCYLGHKKAFYKGIESDSDFILIFECDAVIDVSYEEFREKLDFACSVLNKTDLLMFSFGFHNNVHIIEKNNDYWVVDRFYGAHAYLIPKRSFANIDRMYKESKWNVTDLLFAEKLNMYKIGIFEKPITKQAAGFSILDKVHHEDRY